MQIKNMMTSLLVKTSIMYWVVLVTIGCSLSCTSPVNTHTKKLLSLMPSDTGYLFQVHVNAKSPMAKETARVFQEQKSMLMSMGSELRPFLKFYGSFLEHIQRDQMDKIGLPDQFKIAVYGMWLIPVIIHEVNQKDRYIKWISELSGSEISPHPSLPNIYRFKNFKDKPIYPIIGFSGDQIAQITVVYPEIEAIVMPYLNGQKTHKQSLHQEGSVQRLAKSAQIDGDTLLMWMDIVRIFDMATKPKGLHDKLRPKDMARNLERSNARDEHCMKEIRGLLSNVQALIGGNYKGLNSRFLVKLEPQLAADLRKVTARDILATTPQNDLFGMSLAFDLKGVIEVAQKLIQARLDAPFQCRQLKREFKPNALRKMQTQLAMLPPFATDFQAVSFQLYNAEFNLAAPKADAALILSAKQAPKLLQMAQNLTPMLAEFRLPEAGKGIQEVPGLPLPVSLQPLYSQLEANGLGIALGEQGKKHLKRSMSAPQKGPAPLLRVSYDIDRFSKLIKDKLPIQMQQSLESQYSVWNYITIELGFNKSGFLIETRGKNQSK